MEEVSSIRYVKLIHNYENAYHLAYIVLDKH